ncbi:TIR domain-containing protein [Actinosynnema sp. NPDC050801]|uniref:TIR domain-containing protein n=1 Tax=unclassified Actinosynnema TaxID=2637065 RepID=UPI0033CA9CBF
MAVRRVFLSYAEEDSGTAEQLVAWLADHDLTVFWWQDPARRGDRIVEVVEDELRRADLFIALLSVHYLASGWCRRESRFALRREIKSGTRLIYVLRVDRVDPDEAGLLGDYDLLDLHPPFGPKFPAIAAALGLEVTEAAPEVVSTGGREQEVALVRAALAGSDDFWVVAGPPRMGKSWFLRRLRDELSGTGEWFTVRLLDVQGRETLRTDAVRLLAALLDVDAEGFADTDITSLARQLAERGPRQLYLLDTADRLLPATTAEVRRALAALRRAMAGKARVGVVVGTRRYADWRGLGRTGDARFRSVALAEFGPDVVRAMTVARQATGPAHRIDESARRLHELSQGMPEPLFAWLDWAAERGFTGSTEADTSRAFDAITRPYLRDHLLTAESLGVDRSPDPVRASAVVQRALRHLVVHRLITRSHLRFYAERDPELIAQAAEVGWDLDQLWEVVHSTSLTHQFGYEMWYTISPPIRRLLFRSYYRTDRERAQAHATAVDLYRRWSGQPAYREVAVMAVECLWHEASWRLVEERGSVDRTLPQAAGALAAAFRDPRSETPWEVVDLVAALVEDDSDLRSALGEFDGLSEDVMGAMRKAVE